MSTDYYARLEQSRGPHPSVPVLTSLARALRLTDDERDHLFHLADQAPPPRRQADPHTSPGLLHVLNRLSDTPAFVVSDIGDSLVQNPMSVALSGDIASRPGLARNASYRWFTDPAMREQFPPEDWDRHSHTHVADLRATWARRRGDADVESLVTRLRADSSEFSSLWDRHEVAVRRSDAKAMIHPEVGRLDLLCETLFSSLSQQILVVLYPRPATDAREKLDLLRVIGTQQLTTSR